MQTDKHGGLNFLNVRSGSCMCADGDDVEAILGNKNVAWRDSRDKVRRARTADGNLSA